MWLPLINSVEGYDGTKFIKAGSLDDSAWVTINSFGATQLWTGRL